MTVFNRITINGVDYSDVKSININRSASEYNATSDFNIEFDNYYGRYDNEFSINKKVIVYADKDIEPATTKIFTGIIEDIQFYGSGDRSTVKIMGRDYAAVLQDIIVEPRIFSSTETSQIVTTLMSQNVNSSLVTVNSVDITDLTISKITFNNISVFDSLIKLAELSGFFFYVDEEQDLHFELKASTMQYYPTNPIAQFKLNETTGSTVFDNIGSKNANLKVCATAYWPFDSNMNDFVNGTYNGAISGTNVTSTTNRFANISGAYYFNGNPTGATGSLSYISTPNIIVMRAGSNVGATFGCWIQADNDQYGWDSSSISLMGNGIGGSSFIQAVGSPFGNYESGLILKGWYYLKTPNFTGPAKNIYASDGWGHFVSTVYRTESGTNSGSAIYNIINYWNGETIGSTVTTVPEGFGQWDVKNIGGPWGTKTMIKGYMDEVILFGQALTESSVRLLYDITSRHDLNKPWTSGVNVGAFDFWGESQYPIGSGAGVYINAGSYINNACSGNSPFTIMGWGNMPTDGDGTGRSRICGWYGGNWKGPYIRISDTGIGYTVGQGPNSYIEKSFTMDTKGEWIHIALTYDNSSIKFYKNGEIQDEEIESVVDNGYNQTFTIGRNPWDNFGWYFGRIDDVRAYSKALTQNEIKFIYNDGVGRLHAETAFDKQNTLSAQFRESDNNIYNVVKVFGDRQLTGAKEIFITGTDNTGSIYELDAKPYNVSIALSGTSNTQIQPGGIYYINDPSSEDVHFLVDFQGQRVILTSGTTAGDNTVPAGSKIIIDYQRSTPLIVTKQDETSVNAYGPKHKVVVDRNIKNFNEADDYADNFLSTHSDPIIEGRIDASDIITVNPGNTVIVDVPWQGINEQTYAVTNARYNFNKRNNQNDQVLSVNLNKRIPNILDVMKEQILRLRSLESAEVDTSITSLLAYTGSIGVSGTYKVIQTSIGSAFVFNIPNHDVLESPSSLLGRWIGGSTVIQT